jgi:DNA-binding Xre family transcriptional regulator
MAVKENIIYQIKQKGWSIVTTSQRSGIPEVTIKSIIYGKNNNQKLITLEKFAKAFGCSVSDLISDKPNQEDENNNAKNFDQKLFNKASKNVEKYLSVKDLNFDKSKTLKIIDAVYSLMKKKKNEEVDDSMIEWIIESVLYKN